MKTTTVMGFIGKTPEIKLGKDMGIFTTFQVAVNGGTKINPVVEWVDIVCNDNLAEDARRNLKKGDKVLILGSPKAYAYIDENNEAIAKLRVYAYELQLLSSKLAQTKTN